MKNIKILLIASISILFANCFAQENLHFSNGIYIHMSSDKVSNFIAKDTTVIVPIGKVWNITNAKVFNTYDNRILGNKTFLYLDEQIITYSSETIAQTCDPIWLPSGKYRLTLRSEDKTVSGDRFLYIAFISGVEYDVTK